MKKKLFFIPFVMLATFFSCQTSEQASQKTDTTTIRKTIEQDNIRLSYVVRPGEGPTLILIPGSFSGVHQWDEVMAGLDKDLNLILVEVRGHGQSWPPAENGSIELFAADVKSVADAEKLESFYVGGHSIGGMIAKEVGRRWPQQIRGVISVEGWTHWKVAKETFKSNMYSTLTKEQDDKRLEGRKLGTGHWTDEQRHNFAQIWRQWERGEEFMQTTTLSVLELYGDRGRERPTLEQLYIPAKPNFTLRWFKNASHSLPVERPTQVAEAIGEFIQHTEKTKEKKN